MEDHGRRHALRTIFDKYGTMSMGSMSIAPSNPRILYLGTGELWMPGERPRQRDVEIDRCREDLDAHRPQEELFHPKVQVDPKNPDVVYVAAEGKLYDNEMDSERGLYRSADGGKTWTALSDQGPRRRRFRD